MPNELKVRVFAFFRGTWAYLLAFWVGGSLWAGCASERGTVISKAYHNTTAHYNGYFLGRELLKEAEISIYKSHTDDYNRVLDVIIQPTEQSANTQTGILEEVIKKASIPIQRHKHSKWVDDSYVLIGKARYYRLDFENAIPTFKYVNAKSKDDNLRHEALVWLMRTFMLAEQPSSVQTVGNYLSKQDLSPDNRREFGLTMAQLHLEEKEYAKAGEYLADAVPLARERDQRSRLHFILGQILQMQGQDTDSYYHYRQVLRYNPPYELSFYTKLNMAQVTALADGQDVKRIQKYFRKLLRDQKNLEYQDRIYYEMARFELKRDHLDECLALLRKSVATEGGSPNQKAYSFLLLGELHYDRLRDFNTAKNYYDSTLAFLDPKADNYEQIARRQKVLADFVEQYQIVHRQDSLRQLAAMDSLALSALLDRMVAREDSAQRAQAKALARQERRQQQQQRSLFDDDLGIQGTGGGGGNQWYFYNQAAVSQGRGGFVSNWGRRPLEDDWRRSDKEKMMDTDEPLARQEQEKPGQPGAKTPDQQAPDAPKADPADLLAQRKQALYQDIPLTAEAYQASGDRLAEALYRLGKIYNQRLLEYANSVETFERLVAEFPGREEEPEVYYFLCLTYRTLEKPDRAEAIKARLKGEYPNSTYARKLDNPNFEEENRVAEAAIRQRYRQAYAQYEAARYESAYASLQQIRQEFAVNPFEEQVTLLEMLLIGRMDTISVYRDTLKGFVAAYPNSQLVPHVQKLIKSAENPDKAGQAAASTAAMITSAKPPQEVSYKADKTKPHFFVAVCHLPAAIAQKMVTDFSDYNLQRYSGDKFNTSMLILSDTTFAIVVKQFGTLPQAQQYLRAQRYAGSPLENYRDESETFLITNENFPLWYRSKNTDGYLQFFSKTYAAN